MVGIILLLMIAVPIMEIAVFIQAGEVLGLWPTLLTVILTAAMGTALLRHQGLATLKKVQDSMNAGRPPVAEMFDGLCLFVAGLLLLTPGFVTDGIGFLLFVPPLRSFILGGVVRRLSASMRAGMHARGEPGPGGADGGRGHDSIIIEGDYHEVGPGPKDGSDTPPDHKNNLPGPR